MAYYNQTEQENAVLDIQRLLRDLSYQDSRLGKVRLNGQYDEETKDAVRRFQEIYALPVTGVVDHTTWQVINAVYKAQREATELARAVYLLPRVTDYRLTPGLRDNTVYILQHMLEVISREISELEGVELNGIYDSATEDAVKSFQRISLLEPTGILDATTFNRLADEYERINSYNE